MRMKSPARGEFDVQARPIWQHPRTRLTPHASSNYTAVRHVLFDKIAADLDRFIRGEPPSDIVDTVAGY
jgi:phosphoglycerate dehydrogenase-like enzyme